MGEPVWVLVWLVLAGIWLRQYLRFRRARRDFYRSLEEYRKARARVEKITREGSDGT